MPPPSQTDRTQTDREPGRDDAFAYRRALGAFPTGVCVVTADTDDGPLGITVNSFTSVSLEPRLVLWCLDERSQRWPPFSTVERFCIHVLGADDRDLAARFARGICALDPSEFTRADGGAPRLKGAVSRLDCRTHKRIRMGDHMIIVGEVDGFETVEGDALAFFRGRYGRIGEHLEK